MISLFNNDIISPLPPSIFSRSHAIYRGGSHTQFFWHRPRVSVFENDVTATGVHPQTLEINTNGAAWMRHCQAKPAAAAGAPNTCLHQVKNKRQVLIYFGLPKNAHSTVKTKSASNRTQETVGQTLTTHHQTSLSPTFFRNTSHLVLVHHCFFIC